MVRFRKNPFFEREMKAEPEAEAVLEDAADAVAEHAGSAAHRIMPRGSGDQISAASRGGEVVVENLDHGAIIDEFGSRNNPPYAPLRKGVRAAGLKLRE